MRGGLLCQAGRSDDLHKASGLENLFKPNAMKLASMAEVQPSLCNYNNSRAPLALPALGKALGGLCNLFLALVHGAMSMIGIDKGSVFCGILKKMI